MVKHSYWVVLAVVVLAGCGPVVVYEEQFDVAEDGWAYSDSLTYDLEVTDTIQPYDLVLSLAHSDAFSYENLYAMISTTFPDGRYTTQQLSLQLTDAADVWLGKCKDEYCVVDIPIAEHRRFKVPGKYTITIAQHGRQQRLAGIKSLTLRLQETPQ